MDKFANLNIYNEKDDIESCQFENTSKLKLIENSINGSLINESNDKQNLGIRFGFVLSILCIISTIGIVIYYVIINNK
jgi:hypothetical protein